jgi:hypothetical protein
MFIWKRVAGHTAPFLIPQVPYIVCSIQTDDKAVEITPKPLLLVRGWHDTGQEIASDKTTSRY